MSFDTLPSKEEGGKTLYQCPHCKQWVDHFDWYGDIHSPMCPNCKRLVRRELVPPEAIVWKPAGSRSSRKKSKKKEEEEDRETVLEEIRKQLEEGEEEEEMSTKKEEKRKSLPRKLEEEFAEESEELLSEEEGLFEVPKPPERVLFEILSQYKHIKPEFIRAMVRRSKLKGGLTPDELKYFLVSMKSGVKSEAEASFIAEEYALALKSEAEKAKKQGYPISYPLPNYMSPKPSPPPISTTSPYSYGSSSTYYRSPSTWVSTPMPSQGQDITALINSLRQEFDARLRDLFEERERRKLEDRLHQMEIQTREQIRDIVDMMKNMQNQFQQALQQMQQQFTEALKEIAQMAQQPPPGVVTKEELEKLQLEQIIKMYEKQLEFWKKLDEEKSKRIEELLNELRGWKEKTEKERLELLREIERLSREASYKPTGYQSDEMRLIAEGIHTLAETIRDRKPVELLIKTVGPALVQPHGAFSPMTQQEKPQYVEVPEESKSKVTKLLEGTEYVAEE